MRHTAIAIALIVSGCETVPWAADQADIIIDRYEAEYGDVSDSEAQCVYDTPVTYPLRGAPNCCQGDYWCLGCTIVRARHPRVFIRRDISAQAKVDTVRHEYIHVLLWCMTGDMAADHDAPEFGYSGDVGAAGSLAQP